MEYTPPLTRNGTTFELDPASELSDLPPTLHYLANQASGAWSTAERAKKTLQVTSTNTGDRWTWQLPRRHPHLCNPESRSGAEIPVRGGRNPNPEFPLFLKHQEPSTKHRDYNLRTSSPNRGANPVFTTRYATPPHPCENLRTCTRNRGAVAPDCGARTRPGCRAGRSNSHPNPRALSAPRFLIDSFVIESSF